MDRRHEEILRQNMVAINKNLMVDDEFLCHLIASRMITDANMEEILSEKTKAKRVTAFLFTIKRRGPKAFSELIKALVDTTQDYLAELLDRPNAERLIRERDHGENIGSRIHTQETYQEIVSPAQPQPQASSLFNRQGSINAQDSAFMSPSVQMVNMKDERIRKLMADTKHVYPVKHAIRGRAVIINNEHFLPKSDGKHLSTRDGTQYDLVNLDELFGALQFQTKIYDNKTRNEILDILKVESKNSIHSTADAFIMCILSHGAKGYAYGRDGEKISIDEEICAAFDGKNCPALVGKPKIFIIQACQGKDSTTGIPVADDDADAASSLAKNFKDLNMGDVDSAPQFLPNKVHEKADMIVAYSTVAGYKSWRRPDIGSWFIRSIVEIFSKRAHEEHLEDMLTKVRARVTEFQTSYQAGDIYVQITKTDSTLSKNFYFLPGYKPN